MIDLAIADVGIAGPAAGLEAGVRELFAKRLERNAILQRQRRSEREAVHEAADRGTFFRHLDEDLAGFSVGIEADGDVAFVVGDFEFVRDRHALFLKLVAHGAGRTVGIVFGNVGCGGVARGIVFGGVGGLGAGG